MVSAQSCIESPNHSRSFTCQKRQVAPDRFCPVQCYLPFLLFFRIRCSAGTNVGFAAVPEPGLTPRGQIQSYAQTSGNQLLMARFGVTQQQLYVSYSAVVLTSVDGTKSLNILVNTSTHCRQASEKYVFFR